MAIIISKNGRNAEKVEQSDFGLEDKLQEYIYNNPDSIPLYDINEDIRLFIAAREFSTKSGPIDALGFDSSGNIYVVETKLFKNPDKRTVVAQALDYGASLWRHATDFDEFTSQLDLHTQKDFSLSFAAKYADFFGLDDATDNLQSIKSNLADGVIKFVVLMDKLHDPLKDLVVFVNQNSKFDLYAVELEYYKHESFEIVIPKLFGAEVKKDIITKTKQTSWKWNVTSREEFISSAERQAFKNPLINPEWIHQTLTLIDQVAELTGGTVEFGHVVTKTRDVGKSVIMSRDKHAVVNFDSDTSFSFYMFSPDDIHTKINTSLLNKLADRSLFKKDKTKRDATQFFFNLNGASQSDFDEFVKLYLESVKVFVLPE